MIRKYMLAAAIFLCYIHGSDNKDVFSGPTSKLSKYTVVNPQLIHRGVRSINGLQSSEESDGKDTLTYSLNITKRKHLLHLKRNKDFLSKDFVQYSHDASGKYTSTHPKQHGNCYYHGHVEGQEDSLVALSTCSGLRGVIFIGREIYGLEPVPQSNEHILYLLSDVQSELVVCGVANETTESHSPFDPGHSVTERRKRNLPDTSYVELALVVDNLRYTFKKRNETAVREEMVELANLLDAYYKQLNIRVVLVGLEVFKDDNPFSVVGSAGEVLERFVKWRKTSLLPRIRNDVGQLIVGRPGPYGGAVLGMAFVGTVCSVASSGGINVFSDNSLPYFSTVVAHEMGHNLGMNHDDERCSCDGGSCIMSASASGTTKFSTCSGQDFERLVRRGGGVCLKNQPSPSDVEGVAKCGNGMLEEGEQCDCGTPEECKNKCCDAATCTLTPGAACGQGECCSNCQVRVAGTPCRGSSNTCDLPEYCNGTNPFCPDDFYVMDGLPCENDAAYCYGGRCQTYGYQCRHLFEEDAVKAADICFQHANTQGNIFGNCGRDSSGHLIKCSVANAMCGKVQCTNVDVNRPPPGAHVSIQIIQGSSCVNADFNLGSDDVLDPAYVNPGSPCGKGKVCLDFNCVNASALLPNLNCDAQRTCNGRGLCNDRGHCHCNDGRAPPFCRWSGRGGSVDSGPAQIDYSLRDGLLIFFLLVVPVVTFLILLLLYIFKRDSLERCLKRSLRRSRNAENGHSNGQTNGNAQTTTQRPMQDLPAKPHGNPPDFSAPAPGYRYGELDYWNTDSKAPTPPSAPSSQPPVIITQGPRVPKPFPPKQEPH